jgi:NDP-4-keto-2,6-dideoxyhexose 3-C-methyltransferase
MRDCRSCGGELTEVLHLGKFYLPSFTDPGTDPGEAWPLQLCMCTGCTLVQLGETVPRDLLYRQYGFRSGTNEAVRADLKSQVDTALEWFRRPGSWLDIACNDGTLLSYVEQTAPDAKRVGVDPVASLALESSRYAHRLIPDYFSANYFTGEQFDVITSSSMFYDLDDPNEFVAAVSGVMEPESIWIIQQNYAPDMLSNNAVDNICHEHVTYFSLTSLVPLLGRHGLEIKDVSFPSLNGGCFRVVVGHSHSGTQSSTRVAQALEEEKKQEFLNAPDRWREWGSGVKQELEKASGWLMKMSDQGKRVYLYGASNRGCTLLQIIASQLPEGVGLPLLLPYAVERQKAKVGKVIGAAGGIPIISEEDMRVDKPYALLVGPWFFRDVFVEREARFLADGGKFVFPLPHFEIVGQ